MEFNELGKTGIKVSLVGLGGGGHSRLGLSFDNPEDQAIEIVREALDLGINFFDTAESYGTEVVMGKGLKDAARDQVFVSTKAGVEMEGRRCTASEMRDRVDACLARLGMDYVDVFHLHAVTREEYPYAVSELVPELLRLREAGKIRFLGITERFFADTAHGMLELALKDDCWDVMMVGFSLLNQSARETVFPTTQAKDIGVLDMFAVRRALSKPESLVTLFQELVARGDVSASKFDPENPLGFLMECAESIPEAAYRYCRYEPRVHCVLSGTSRVEHLRENARSILGGPLPESVLKRLKDLLGHLDWISGN